MNAKIDLSNLKFIDENGMKPIDNTYDLVKELKNGNKRIGVTEDFYNWLKVNIKTLKYEKVDTAPPIVSYYGVTIYVDKDMKKRAENEKK